MTHLIGINGFKGAGKDTICKIAAELVPDQVVGRLAFADKVKLVGLRALGFTGTDEEVLATADDFKRNGGVTVFRDEQIDDHFHSLVGRQYLRDFGMTARKVMGEDVWVNQILPSPVAAEGWGGIDPRDPIYASDYLFVTDVRMPNEARRVLDLGGQVWEVTRAGVESDGDESEIALPRELVTLTIKNDLDLDHLRTLVKVYLGALEA